MPDKKVNLNIQLLSSILLVTSLIAFARIKKLKHGVLLNLGIFGLDAFIQALLPWPYGLLIGLGISYYLLAHFMLKWSKQWNESLDKVN